MTNFAQALEVFQRAASRAVETSRSVPTERWGSFADTLEHMAIANQLNFERLSVLTARAPDMTFETSLQDEEIPYLFWRAPEPPGLAVPTGTWMERDDAIDRFERGASLFANLADYDDQNMRNKGDPHPLFGFLDGVQWVLFAAAHTERHRAEMIGILAASLEN